MPFFPMIEKITTYVERKLSCCCQDTWVFLFQAFWSQSKVNHTCFPWTSFTMRNPVSPKDITVLCYNIVLFIRIAPVRNNLTLKGGRGGKYIPVIRIAFCVCIAIQSFNYQSTFHQSMCEGAAYNRKNYNGLGDISGRDWMQRGSTRVEWLDI